MAKINYVKGDATYPIGDGNKIITHICNDEGKWGSGFVMALNARWGSPRDNYLSYPQFYKVLGNMRILRVEKDICVANIVGQKGVMFKGRKDAPIRYESVEIGLYYVGRACEDVKEKGMEVSVHMPRMGCDRAGGTWEEMEPIIKRTLVDKGIEVFVYDYEGTEFK